MEKRLDSSKEALGSFFLRILILLHFLFEMSLFALFYSKIFFHFILQII